MEEMDRGDSSRENISWRGWKRNSLLLIEAMIHLSISSNTALLDSTLKVRIMIV